MPLQRSLAFAIRRTALLGSAAGSGWVLQWAVQPRVAAGFELVHGGGDRTESWTLDALVVDLAACVATAVWLLLMTSAALTIAIELLAIRWPRRRTLYRLTGPTWWRRLVLSALGLGLAAPTLGVAPLWASTDNAHPSSRCRAECPVRLDGLPLPELQPDSGRPHGSGWTRLDRRADSRRPRERQPSRTGDLWPVTVRRGDSLWLIASRQLGNGASDAALARRSERIYSANRPSIGPDPDLIFPGTHLIRPGGTPDAH